MNLEYALCVCAPDARSTEVAMGEQHTPTAADATARWQNLQRSLSQRQSQ